jgi:hypothetical protein
MKKLLFLLITFIFFSFFVAKIALAICPVCTVAVGSALGLSRYLGIDDTISGLWLGGLIVSLIFWTIDWLDKKNIKFKGRNVLTIVLWYLFLILPLYFLGFLGNPQNSLLCFCGIYFEKLFLGILTGSFAFWSGAEWYYYLKERNQGHAYFPFQKVVMPIAPLIVLSLIFYFLLK